MSLEKARPIPRPKMTEEARRTQLAQAYFQKRASLIEGILFNLCQSSGADSAEPDALVDKAIAMAERLMDRVYKIPDDENAAR